MNPVLKIINKLREDELFTKSAGTMLIKVAGMFSGYLFIFIALRLTSLEDYGVFTLCLASVQLTAMVGRMGFDLSVVKNISMHVSNSSSNNQIQDIYLKGLRLVGFAGLLLTIVFYFVSPVIATQVFSDSAMLIQLRIMSIAILPLILTFYNAGALRGMKRVWQYSALINLLFLLSLITIGILFFFVHKNILQWAYVCAALAICLLSFIWWMRASKVGFNLSVSSETYRSLLALSLPMLSASAITQLNGWSDTLLLGVFSDQEAVGIFQVLLKLAAIINIVLFSVNSISAPQFARISLENKVQLQGYVMSSTKLIVMSVFPIVIILLLAYHGLVDLLGGGFIAQDFFLAFSFLCFGQLFNAFCGSGGQLLSMTGYHHVNRNIIAIGFVISLILNLVLIPTYGVTGAAFANMAGIIARNLMYVLFTNRKLRVNTVYNPVADLSKLLRS